MTLQPDRDRMLAALLGVHPGDLPPPASTPQAAVPCQRDFTFKRHADAATLAEVGLYRPEEACPVIMLKIRHDGQVNLTSPQLGSPFVPVAKLADCIGDFCRAKRGTSALVLWEVLHDRLQQAEVIFKQAEAA